MFHCGSVWMLVSMKVEQRITKYQMLHLLNHFGQLHPYSQHPALPFHITCPDPMYNVIPLSCWPKTLPDFCISIELLIANPRKQMNAQFPQSSSFWFHWRMSSEETKILGASSLDSPHSYSALNSTEELCPKGKDDDQLLDSNRVPKFEKFSKTAALCFVMLGMVRKL